MNNTLGKLRRNWKLVLGLGVVGLFAAVLLVIGGAAGLAGAWPCAPRARTAQKRSSRTS